MKRVLGAVMCLVACAWLPAMAEAVAPPRNVPWAESVGLSAINRPYAESQCNTNPDIIFCEDFNYAETFVCLPNNANGQPPDSNHAWLNPARVGKFGSSGGQNDDQVPGCTNRVIDLASNYPTAPNGALPGSAVADRVWTSPMNGSSSAYAGSPIIFGDQTMNGGVYKNGTPLATDVYVRLQYYLTPNWAWPGDPKTSVYCYANGGNATDQKILFLYPNRVGYSGTTTNPGPTSASFDAGLYHNTGSFDPAGPGDGCGNGARYADTLSVRVGNAAEFAYFPNCGNCSVNPSHTEYRPYQNYTLRNPNFALTSGKMYRINTGRWYTLEMRYKVGTQGQRDGIVTVWIDGVQLYHGTDLVTCGSGNGGCASVGVMFLSSYHNGIDNTNWSGTMVVDNLVISRSYIGPPQQETGLIFPSNPNIADGQTVRFRWQNPQTIGLPIYGPNGVGVTYIWKIQPIQQTGYYTTMFWSNDNGQPDGLAWHSGAPFIADTYYGAHPYPSNGSSSGMSHLWEIAVEGNDFTNGIVTKDQWYTQVFQASGAVNTQKTHTFYWNWPATDAANRTQRISATTYGNLDPPFPTLTFGDAPWNQGAELCSCIIRGIQIYNALLSQADIAAEISAPMSTPAGAASMWYLNVNPTPIDISDKSGRGHHPSWVGALRPSLYSGSSGPPPDTTPPAAPTGLRVSWLYEWWASLMELLA